MKALGIRMATLVVGTLAAAAGTTLSAATAAQTAAQPHYTSAWTCTALTMRDAGEVYGRSCYGFGTRSGVYYLVGSGYTVQYQCAVFQPVDGFPPPFTDPSYNERGTGCVYVGPGGGPASALG